MMNSKNIFVFSFVRSSCEILSGASWRHWETLDTVQKKCDSCKNQERIPCTLMIFIFFLLPSISNILTEPSKGVKIWKFIDGIIICISFLIAHWLIINLIACCRSNFLRIFVALWMSSPSSSSKNFTSLGLGLRILRKLKDGLLFGSARHWIELGSQIAWIDFSLVVFSHVHFLWIFLFAAFLFLCFWIHIFINN